MSDAIVLEKLDFLNGEENETPINASNLNKMQENTQNAINKILETLFPIGKVEIFFDPGNHSNHLGFEWELVAVGKNLVGVGIGTDKNGKTKTFVVGDNEGEYSHTLLKTELPNEQISVPVMTTAKPYGASNTVTYQGNVVVSEGGESDVTLTTDALGNGTAFDITNPTYGVYIWKRKA